MFEDKPISGANFLHLYFGKKCADAGISTDINGRGSLLLKEPGINTK